MLGEHFLGKVLVVGDVMLDHYILGDSTRLSPEAPVPVVNIGKEEKRLGGAANVALNVASLGCEVALLGIVGNDSNGEYLRRELNKLGVRTFFTVATEAKTIHKIRILSRNQQMLRVDFEDKFSDDLSKECLGYFKSLVDDFDIVIFSDYGKGVLKYIPEMIEASNQHDKRSLIDPKGVDFDKYSHSTVITPNKSELRAVVGEWDSEDILKNRVESLRESLDINKILLTRSEEGMTLFSKDGSFSVKAEAKEVFDVSGAGDTVIAVLAVLLINNFDIRDSVSIANRAGGIVVGKLGTATVSYDELFGQAA